MRSVTELIFGVSSPFAAPDPLETLKELNRRWEASDRLVMEYRPVWSFSGPAMSNDEIERLVARSVRRQRHRKTRPVGEAMRPDEV